MRRSLGALLLASGTLACARVELNRVPADPGAVPAVLVAVAVDAREVRIGGGDALRVLAPDGQLIARIPAGVTARLEPGPDGRVRLQLAGTQPSIAELPVIAPEDSSGRVRLDGRDLRGTVTVLSGAGGLTPVNRVELEAYLAGVVNAEMGRRGTSELAALHAQAVVSRTVAYRALGRSRVRGYDVVATVSDQVYGGVTAETEQGWEAVRATRGEILWHDGAVIDAFFGSTCGGRTADGGEVFEGARQHPYLRSVHDVGPGGEAWCAISPRYRWREEWTGDALTAVLRETLPLAGNAARPGAVREVAVEGRSATGRVIAMRIEYGDGAVSVRGPSVRRVLRPAGQSLLRSARFDLHPSRSGGRLQRLVAEGGGAGHGVGLCQWGAVGRARAGFNYREILAAYFPGTELRRAY